jgi:DNA-binding MarR family transcriptional regulator
MSSTSTPSFPPPEPNADRRSALAMDMNAFIPAALTNLAQKIAATASATYRPRFGIGVTEWRIVALLAGEPWIAPVQICEATGLDKAAVSRSLRDLAKAGLIEVRSEEPHRRRLPVALTAKGLAVHDRVVDVALMREERLLKGFSAEERTQLRDFIARMQQEADAIAIAAKG